jgi:hypothetical protein
VASGKNGRQVEHQTAAIIRTAPGGTMDNRHVASAKHGVSSAM